MNGGKYWGRAWSLVEGCTPVSEACDNCWLKAIHMRFCYPRRFEDVRIRPDRLDIPLKTRKPTVFALWSDLFHESVPDEFIKDVFRAMATDILQPCKHTYIVLTKRPQRMAEFFTKYTSRGSDPWPNVYLGITAETQQRLEERLPYLLQVPGKRVLSVEPLLSPLDLLKCLKGGSHEQSREGIFSAGRVGAIQGRRRRENLEAGGDDRRKPYRDSFLLPKISTPEEGGNECQNEISDSDVLLGRKEPPCRSCPSYRVDGCKQLRDTRENGDKSQGRKPEQSSTMELRDGYEIGQHETQLSGTPSQKEVSKRGDEYVRKDNSGRRSGNTRTSRGDDTIKNCPAFRDYSELSLSDTGKEELESYQGLIDLVICGGESGHGARPMELSWVESLVGQCKAAGVPCFVKQMGSAFGKHHKDMNYWPDHLTVRELPWRLP